MIALYYRWIYAQIYYEDFRGEVEHDNTDLVPVGIFISLAEL